jgi:hypothetical protein
MASILAAAAFTARWMTNASARENELGTQFEESPSDELIGLGLDR